MGLSNVVATAKHNLGMVLALSGALEQGLRVEKEALDAFCRQGDRRLEGGAREYLAVILMMCGDYQAAEREAEAALSMASAALVPGSHAVLANVLLAMRRTDEALAEARTAMKGYEELGAVEEGEATIRLALAETLFASGAREEARAAIASARDRLLERAGKISDPERRRTFLERVPENERTLALAKSLIGK
jgi:tetratricopeptide (TPR) repeat protein